MANATEMVNVQIDGKWIQVPKGTRVIEACKMAGEFIPHYCYHPKLSSPGNCRMCMVEMGMPKMDAERKPIIGEDGRPEIGWIPRPQISCAQNVAEGMGIRTSSPMVEECRNGVLEFLLINHPLDCPICDQAGECKLQEFSVDFGKGTSRFLEQKVKKPKNVELGPRVTLDDERCILCSRCIRFMQEVANDDVLGFVDRGSYSTLTCHPDRVLDSNYSLNTVDICPVGALTSSDFRFQMRVWFLKETKSIDVNCGTGSNILIGSRENTIYRITPRENEDVNECWLPDSHRLNFKYIDSDSRLLTPQVLQDGELQDTTWDTALKEASRLLSEVATGKTAVIASGRMTNEELFLVSRLTRQLQTDAVDILPRRGEPDGILVSADRNPNTNGAKLTGVAGDRPGAKLADIVEGVRSGKYEALLLLGENALKCGLTEQDLAKLKVLVVMDILSNPATKHASVVLPAASFAEKRGSMINVKGRLQRLNRAVASPGMARDDFEILRDLIRGTGGEADYFMIEDVFRDLAGSCAPLEGLTLSRIGDRGITLDIKVDPADGPHGATTTGAQA